jgi:FSR family fosmidomycin resistance protein-like MFS transporter
VDDEIPDYTRHTSGQAISCGILFDLFRFLNAAVLVSMALQRFAWLPLLLIATAHFVVDTVAAALNPLWPSFETHYGLGATGVFWLYFAWTVATSVCQLVFGLWGERLRGPWLLWCGPVIATLCLTTFGLVSSPWILSFLLVLGGLGVAAFHPEGAAIAGACAPTQRSRAMSIFATGGFLGQAASPYMSGRIVEHSGLAGLVVGLFAGLIAFGLLFLLSRLPNLRWQRPEPVAWSAATTRGEEASSALGWNGRGPAVALLVLIGILRVIAGAGVPLAVAYWLTKRHSGPSEIGFVQSLFMLGIGVGGLGCAFGMQPRIERLVLWLVPAVAALPLLVIPLGPYPLMCAATTASGLLFGFAQPVLIGFGQQLLPGRQRVASSLTMGVTWGVGGAVISAFMALLVANSWVESAFTWFAGASVLSSVLCWWLPRVE